MTYKKKNLYSILLLSLIISVALKKEEIEWNLKVDSILLQKHKF